MVSKICLALLVCAILALGYTEAGLVRGLGDTVHELAKGLGYNGGRALKDAGGTADHLVHGLGDTVRNTLDKADSTLGSSVVGSPCSTCG